MRTDPLDSPAASDAQLGRFFIPLALQAASQSLTYPLVAIVASRGEGGPLNLAGLAQSNLVMFFLGMLGAGIPTMGMVYAKTREGYSRFLRVNYTIAFAVLGLQALFSLPPLDHVIFGQLIGLPPTIEVPARMTLLWALPLQFLFFLRNPYQVVLLNAKAAGRASSATLARIALTTIMSALFAMAGLVGPGWAVVCLTIPVGFEVLLSWAFAAPFLRDLTPSSSHPPSVRELLAFTLPLSAGGLLLALSGPLLGAFMARAPHPERVLTVYYLATGLASTMAFSASRIQSVVLAFPPTSDRDWSTLRFSAVAGLVLGSLPLVFLIHPIADVYDVSLQKLPPLDLPLLRVTALALVALPLLVALRSEREGLAAFLKRPMAIMAGQAVHVGALVAASTLGLFLGAPGHLIGPIGLIAGNLIAAGTIGMMVRRRRK